MKQFGKPSKVMPMYDLMPPSLHTSLISIPSLFFRPMFVTLYKLV